MRDARGHGSDARDAATLQNTLAKNRRMFGVFQDKRAAATLGQDHPKSGPVPVHAIAAMQMAAGRR